jgi:hypothetical protein
VGTEDGVLEIFSVGNWGDCTDRYPGHPGSIDTIVKIDESTIATGSTDGLIRVVGIHPNQLIGVLGDHNESPIERLRVSHDGEYVASCAHDNTVRFWSLNDDDDGDGDDDDEDDEDNDDDDDEAGEEQDDGESDNINEKDGKSDEEQDGLDESDAEKSEHADADEDDDDSDNDDDQEENVTTANKSSNTGKIGANLKNQTSKPPIPPKTERKAPPKRDLSDDSDDDSSDDDRASKSRKKTKVKNKGIGGSTASTFFADLD